MQPIVYPAAIQWDQVTALTALAALAGGIFLWAVGAVIDKKLAEFLILLNGTYLRTKIADVKFEEIDRRITELHEAHE